MSFSLFFSRSYVLRVLHSFPTRRSSDLVLLFLRRSTMSAPYFSRSFMYVKIDRTLTPRSCASFSCPGNAVRVRSEEHTSELQSRFDLVCRLLLEKKNKSEVTYFDDRYI